MTMHVSRRAALLAGGAALGLAACSSSSTGAPDIATGPFVSGSFRSAARHTTVGWSVSYPPGQSNATLPVLVALHGRGGNHTDAFAGSLHLDKFLAQAVKRGSRPFAIASVDGGNHEYWHPRTTTDPARMVTDEFLPLLARRGLDTTRIGLLGWSMGGYGALYLASTMRRRRVAVAVAESPAIWRHSYQSVSGAFDDAADFTAHQIFGRQHDLAGIALRIDCGAGDSFSPITRELRASITPTPTGGIEPGGHDQNYWRRQAPAQLAFVAQHF